MSKPPKLSPTSYALLGLLARQPRSAYELNTVMQTSLIRVFWPRAESHVYSEPKKLLAHHYVSEQRERSGGRQRTVYTITDQGRTALRAWLAEDTEAQLRNQAEFMLKLLLADEGDTAAARETLARSRAASGTEMRQAIDGIQMILDNPGYAADGMPWNGVAINLMADFLIARHRWSRYALEATGDITDDSEDEQRLALGHQAYREALEKMRAALDEPE